MGQDAKSVDLEPGQVTVTPHGDGWFLVQVGRARYTKRFNLSVDEAAQLAHALTAQLQAASSGTA